MIAAMPSPAQKKQELLSTGRALALVGEIGYLIALPAAILGFGGAYLDRELGTSPIFVMLGLVVALATSAYAVWRRVRSILHP